MPFPICYDTHRPETVFAVLTVAKIEIGWVIIIILNYFCPNEYRCSLVVIRLNFTEVSQFFEPSRINVKLQLYSHCVFKLS